VLDDCLDYLKILRCSPEPIDTPSSTFLSQNDAPTSSAGTLNPSESSADESISPLSQPLSRDYAATFNSLQSISDPGIHIFPQNDSARSSSSNEDAVEAGEEQTDNCEQAHGPFLSEDCIWTINKPTNEVENEFYERILVTSELVVCRVEKQHRLERMASLLLRHDHKTTSKIEGASFRSGGIWVLAEPLLKWQKTNSVDSSWVSANGEWKLENEAENLLDISVFCTVIHWACLLKSTQNHKQVVRAAAHYMNNDPCQSHMFSVSVHFYLEAFH
jgi:hypothetical protein